jgi:hypothetical protein
MFINTITNEYPVSYTELKKRFPNTSFPRHLVEEHEEYRLVQETPRPEYNIDTEKLEENTPVEVDGVYGRSYTKVAKTPEETLYELDKIKSKRKEELAAKRFEIETTHPSLDSTPSGQARFASMWIAAQINPATSIDFKGKDGWSKLTKADIDSAASAVIDWVQACFTNEQVLNTAIDSATTVTEVAAIDISSGWPS